MEPKPREALEVRKKSHHNALPNVHVGKDGGQTQPPQFTFKDTDTGEKTPLSLML